VYPQVCHSHLALHARCLTCRTFVAFHFGKTLRASSCARLVSASSVSNAAYSEIRGNARTAVTTKATTNEKLFLDSHLFLFSAVRPAVPLASPSPNSILPLSVDVLTRRNELMSTCLFSVLKVNSNAFITVLPDPSCSCPDIHISRAFVCAMVFDQCSVCQFLDARFLDILTLLRTNIEPVGASQVQSSSSHSSTRKDRSEACEERTKSLRTSRSSAESSQLPT